VIAYVPDGGTVVTVDLRRLTGARATAYWYDPEAGVATLIGTFVTQGPMNFVSPGDAQVLVLDDAARQFPVPGLRDFQLRPRPSLREPRTMRDGFSRD